MAPIQKVTLVQAANYKWIIVPTPSPLYVAKNLKRARHTIVDRHNSNGTVLSSSADNPRPMCCCRIKFWDALAACRLESPQRIRPSKENAACPYPLDRVDVVQRTNSRFISICAIVNGCRGLKIMFMSLMGLNTSEGLSYVREDDAEEVYVEVVMTRRTM